MASFNFQTTIESMDKAHGDVESAKSQLDSALSALQAELESAIPGWVGQASSAYTSLQGQWNDDQRQINSALDDLGAALAQATSNYQRTEEANAQSFPAGS